MTTKHIKGSIPWHVGLWIAQILLGGMFLALGFMKTFAPVSELSKVVPIAAEMPALIRFIGVSELAGGLGLLLPAALRIWPRVTVLAAAALALVMAFGHNLSRNAGRIFSNWNKHCAGVFGDIHCVGKTAQSANHNAVKTHLFEEYKIAKI